MGERAKHAARTIAGDLHVIALGRLVDLRMELLFGARVTILTVVAGLAVGRFAPLLAMFDVRTRRRAVRTLREKATHTITNGFFTTTKTLPLTDT